MNILVVCQYYYPEQFKINDICETLVKNGNNVTVLTGLPNYEEGIVSKEYKFLKKRKENINGVNILRCFETGRRKGTIYRIINYISYMISASCKAIFLNKDFDIIYVYQLSPITMTIPAIIYKKIHKKKLVLYCLDLWPESVTTFGIKNNSFMYKIINKLSKYVYSKADKIIVSSKSFKDILNDKTKKDIKYIPQYADVIFKESKLNESEKHHYIFAGNIGKAQSVQTIIKAANYIRNDENIIIDIVGDGSSIDECKALAKEMKLSNVIFHGRKRIEEMQEFYDKASAMIVTLSKDNFACQTLPAKVQACMATKNAIIASANGETARVIQESNCGYCVEAEDAQKLANIILEFTNLSIKERETLRNNSLNYYNENFKKEIFIIQLENIFKEEIKNV